MPSGTLRIIMERNGKVAVDIPTAELAADPDRLSAHLTRLQSQGYTLLKTDATVADLPSETANPRRFRNAWTWDGANLVHDLPACRDQLMEEIRKERNIRLDDSDKKKNQLDDIGTGPQQAAYATYRQSLRDLPTTVQSEIDILSTPSALEAYEPTWPTEPT